MSDGVTPYRRPTLLVPLLEQTVPTLVSSLLSDYGRVATAGLCVSIAFWTGAFAICTRWRRSRETLSRSDRLYLCLGLPSAWVVGVPLFHWIWAVKGAI